MTRWLLSRLWRGAGPWQWLLGGVLLSTVALATLVVLFLASIPVALDRQENRLAWTQPADWTQQADPQQDPDYVMVNTVRDEVGGLDVLVVNTAVHGAGIPPPSGVGRFPDPGDVMLSPALHDLLTARDDLDRYGRSAGMLAPEALAGPTALMAVRGTEPDQLSPVAVPVLSLAVSRGTTLPATLALTLTLAGVAMLTPPLLLAYVSTRAASRSRQRQTAALVIAGAPRRLLTRLVAVEAATGAVLGTAVGLGAFLLVRGLVAPLVVEAPAPFAADLVPPWPVTVLTVLLLPLGVAAISVRTARRTVQEPLAARVTAREPGGTWLWAAAGVLVLLAGVVGGASGVLPRSQAVLAAMASGAVFLLCVAPALCRGIGAALLRSSRGTALLAGGSLAAAPRAAARMVSTAVLAVFVASTFVIAFPTAVDASYRDQPVIEQSADTVSVELLASPPPQVQQLVERIAGLAQVEAVAAVVTGQVQTGRSALAVWIGDCQAIVEAAAMDPSSCSGRAVSQTPLAESELAGAGEVEITGLPPAEVTSLVAVPDFDAPSSLALPVDRAVSLSTSPAAVDRPQIIVDVGTAELDASAFRPTLVTVGLSDAEAVEDVRELALAVDPTAQVTTRASSQEGFDGGLRRYYWLMTWGAVLTMLTAAAGVFTGAVSDHIERARVTSVLWALGTPRGTLRRAALLAILAPLVVLSVLASLLGVLSATMIIPGTSPAWAALRGLWPVWLGLGLTGAAGGAASWLLGATSATQHIRHE